MARNPTGGKHAGRDARGKWLPGYAPNPKGRPPGARDKIVIERLLTRANQITPLQFLLDCMTDPRASKRTRIQAAIAAAPFVHARLASHDVTMQRVDVSKLTDAEVAELLRIHARLQEARHAHDQD